MFFANLHVADAYHSQLGLVTWTLRHLDTNQGAHGTLLDIVLRDRLKLYLSYQRFSWIM